MKKNLSSKNIISSLQLSSAYTRLFHCVNELSEENEKAFDILVEFATYSIDKGHIPESLLPTLKQQVEIRKDVKKMKQLKAALSKIIKEYFVSGDVADTIASVKELDISFYHHELVKRMISIALDLDNNARESCSVFLATCVGDLEKLKIQKKLNENLDIDFIIIDFSSAILGFEMLLQRVEDLYKDVPDIVHLLGCFIARAIVDEALPPIFLDQANILESDAGYHVIEYARTLLSKPLSHETLSNIWGPVASNQSVKELKDRVRMLLKEYLVGEDLNEAVVAIKEMKVPMFHHEIVKQLIMQVADWVPPKTLGMGVVTDKERYAKARLASDLLTTCVGHNIMSMGQVKKGFQKIQDRIDDIKLDCPKIEPIYNYIAENFDGVPFVGASQH